MPTIVCQNRVSRFEPGQVFFETTTTLKLKVTNLDDDVRRANPNLEFGNWGCTQTAPKEGCYSQPWVAKPSFSKLTPRSLALCTETLGCESGTDSVAVTDGAAIFRSSYSGELSTTLFHRSHEDECFYTAVTSTTNSPPKKSNLAKVSRKKTDFPPPLTSTLNGLQMRRHREGGRLVIQAVEAAYGSSYLETERGDGRLRMRFFKPAAEQAGGEEESDETGVENEIEGGETAVDSEIEGGRVGIEELMEEEGNNLEKYEQRMSRRCKEGSSHGSNWKLAALWVATS